MDTITYIRQHRQQAIEELKAFLRIPSISTQPIHQGDIEAAAAWLRERLEAAGFPQVEVMRTAGHPVVYAEWSAARADAPTVLIYGHYDVQPPDPVELWQTPPFDPTIRGDDLFARGASDDKGQMWIHVKVAEAFGKTAGAPPVHLKCIFEGEEEIGSPSLGPFVQQNAARLQADVALISDTHIHAADTPTIVYALRGLSYIEVEVTGPDHDLHSGIYGGAVRNPINALCHMIAQLQDAHGRIMIPGFYDAVRPLTPEERLEYARLPFSESEWLAEAGVTEAWGEPEYSILERLSARPTLDVNGIYGGYVEPGAKTVLPSTAFAKISMRLVPDQDPDEITRLVSDYLMKIAPSAVKVRVRDLQGGAPAIVARESDAMRAAVAAYAEVFGADPIFVREGGSIPVVTTLKRYLGIDTVLMGFGLPDDRLHSPNEKVHIPTLYRGLETVARFLMHYGK